MKTQTTKVFISYSTDDNALAYKLYADLERSGASVYLYERVGKPGINFKKEINISIESANFFCLLDSPSARNNSLWVKKECKKAIEVLKKDNILKIIPCYVKAKEDSWFKRDYLFEEHELIRGIDFSGLTRFDDTGKYRIAITELCNTMGLVYTPWSAIPDERDFEKELASIKGVDPKMAEVLTNDYKSFNQSIYLFPKNIRYEKIRLLNEQCAYAEVRLSVCSLALCFVLLTQNRLQEAKRECLKATKEFTFDPRAFLVLAIAQYLLGELGDSLNSLNSCISIIDRNPENTFMKYHRREIICRKIQILLDLKQVPQAKELIKIENNDHFGEFLVAQNKIKLLEGSFSTSENTYKKLMQRFYNFTINDVILNYQIGGLEAMIANYFVNKQEVGKAKKHYRLAISANPKSITYYSELAKLLYCDGQNEFRRYVSMGLKLIPNDSDDYYYYGQLYFLEKNYETAYFYYNRSEKNWPFYKDLFS